MSTSTEAPPTTTFAVIANRAELAEHLGAVRRAVPSRLFKPILGCVLLTAEDGRLAMRATDLEISIQRTQHNTIQIDAPGRVAVSCEDLLQWARLADGDTVAFELSGDTLHAKAASCSYQFPTIPVDEFPPPPSTGEKPEAVWEVPLEGLRTAYQFVTHAAGEKPGNFAYHGIYFVQKDGALVLTASEGHMIATTAIKDAKADPGRESALIHNVALAKMLAAMPDDEETLRVAFFENCVLLACESCEAHTLQIEGKAAPYESEYFQRGDVVASCAREHLIETLNRAALAAKDDSGLTPYIIAAFDRSGIALKASTAMRGRAEARLPCRVTGGQITIGFNAKNLSSALSAMAGEDLEIHLRSPNRPFKIICGPFTEIQAPVNLRE